MNWSLLEKSVHSGISGEAGPSIKLKITKAINVVSLEHKVASMESLKALSKELQSNAEGEEEQKILKLIPFSLALSMFIHELTEPKTKKEAESMFPNLLKDFGVSMGDSPEIETMSLMFERLSRDFVGDE